MVQVIVCFSRNSTDVEAPNTKPWSGLPGSLCRTCPACFSAARHIQGLRLRSQFLCCEPPSTIFGATLQLSSTPGPSKGPLAAFTLCDRVALCPTSVFRSHRKSSCSRVQCGMKPNPRVYRANLLLCIHLTEARPPEMGPAQPEKALLDNIRGNDAQQKQRKLKPAQKNHDDAPLPWC